MSAEKIAAARELVRTWRRRADVADELAASHFEGELAARLRDMAAAYRTRARELAELLGP